MLKTTKHTFNTSRCQGVFDVNSATVTDTRTFTHFLTPRGLAAVSYTPF